MVKLYNCEICQSIFNKKSNYIRHKNKQKQCNPILSDEDDNENDLHIINNKFEQNIIEEHINTINNLKKENYNLIQKIYNITNDYSLYSSIRKKQKINVMENYDKIYNNICMTNFGNEDTSYINTEFMKKMIMNPFVGIINIIREVHFNQKYRMNHNIRIISYKFKNVEIYSNNEWKLIQKEDIFHNIITTKKDIMDTYFIKLCNEHEIEKSYIDNYNTFSNLLNKYTNVILFSNMQSNKLINEKRIYINICKSIQVMLMNSLKNITNLFEIEQFDSNLLNKKHVIFTPLHM